MDDIDRKLLMRLQEDATISMADLADHVSLSATPVWKRIQKLEKAGVIKRRVALLEPELVGVGLTVLIAIEAHEHSSDWLAAFAAAIAGMPEVMDAYRMAGEVDYMLRVAVPNMTSRFAMERLKQTTSYPLPARAFCDRRGAEPDLDTP